MNDGQEAFRKFTRQLRVGGGNKFPGGGGLFAGSGLLFALAAGGIALNSALFNGTRLLGLVLENGLLFLLVDGGHRAIKYSRCVWKSTTDECD